MITDRMRINHADTDAIPDYGSLFLRIFDKQTHVNDYCGSDDSDVDKLDLITNAAVGSTCLFISGKLYVKTFDGWEQYGGTSDGASNFAGITSLNIDRNALLGKGNFDDDETGDYTSNETENNEEFTAEKVTI